MGTLIHGTHFEVGVDDESLFHLDMALGLLGTEGVSVRVHTMTADRLVSFPGEGITLVYENGPHLKVDEGLFQAILDEARGRGILTVPFLTVPFERDDGEVG
jgi:hypothetical protein